MSEAKLPPLEQCMCNPPGSVGTAIDIDVSKPTERRCGMCMRRIDQSKLFEVCPHCKHRLNWFQLIDVGGLPDSPQSEAALKRWFTNRRKRQAKQDSLGFDTAFMDGPDDER